MANEYRLHATHAEVIRSSPVSNARLAAGYVEVIRTVDVVTSTWMPRAIIVIGG